MEIDSDVVLVPVPVSALSAVLAARDAALGSSAYPGRNIEPPDDGPRLGGGWDAAMLRRFADKLNYPLVHELFDACAAAPGTWIPKAQIDGAGDPKQLRNELGAMTKLIRKIFTADTEWPIEFRKLRGQYDYRLDEDTAAAWRKISDAAPALVQ